MNKLQLLIALVFLIFSCEKSPVPYDHEAGMETGNATLLKSVTVIDTFSTYLTARAEFVHFEDLESRSSFTNDIVNSTLYFDTETEVTSTSSYSPTTFKNYRNLILINPDNLIWLESFAPGYYLDRYFNQLETDGSSAGLCEMGNRTNYEPSFYTENTGNIFGNSAAFNTSSFYDITRTEHTSTSGYDDNTIIDLKAFLQGLDALLDELIPFVDPSEDLVITSFIHGEYGFEAGTETLFETVFQKCWDNNIRINVISYVYNFYDMEIAMYSGGFHLVAGGCFEAETNSYIPCDASQRVSPAGVVLQNLHDLLRGRYTSQVVEFTMSKTDDASYMSSQLIFGALNCNGSDYILTVNKHQ